MRLNVLITDTFLVNEKESKKSLVAQKLSYYTPPRTPTIRGLKSQVLKQTLEIKNDVEKWSKFFYFQILLAL